VAVKVNVKKIKEASDQIKEATEKEEIMTPIKYLTQHKRKSGLEKLVYYGTNLR
jgi:hypothetical protein